MTATSFTESLELQAAELPTWKLTRSLTGSTRTLALNSASVLCGHNVRYKAGTVPMTGRRYVGVAIATLMTSTLGRSWLSELRRRQQGLSTSPSYANQPTKVLATEFVVSTLMLVPIGIPLLTGRSLGRHKYPLSRLGRASQVVDLGIALSATIMAGRELYRRRDEWLFELTPVIEVARTKRHTDDEMMPQLTIMTDGSPFDLDEIFAKEILASPLFERIMEEGGAPTEVDYKRD